MQSLIYHNVPTSGLEIEYCVKVNKWIKRYSKYYDVFTFREYSVVIYFTVNIIYPVI